MAQVPPNWTARSGRTSWRGATRPRMTMWMAKTTAQPKVSKSPTSWAFPAAPPPDKTAMPNTAMTTPAICGVEGRFLKKTSSMSARSAISRAYEVEADSEHGVDGHEEGAFQPVRLAVERDDGGGEHREPDRRRLEAREGKVHRRAEDDTGEDQDGRDEQGDLLGGLPGDAERDVHLAAPAESDGRGVLGCVADDGDDDDAHEGLGQVNRLQRAFEGADEKLTGYSGRGAGEEQPAAGPPGVCEIAPPGLLRRGGRLSGGGGKERPWLARRDYPLLGPKLEEQGEPVHDDEHDGDLFAQQFRFRVGPGGRREERRDGEGDDREEERGDRRAGGDPVEADGRVPRARHRDGASGDEQEISQDAARDAALHQGDMPPGKRENPEDELGGVAEARVEDCPGPRPEPLGEVLGGIAHRLGERHQGQAGAREHEDVPLGSDQPGDDRDGQQQPGSSPHPGHGAAHFPGASEPRQPPEWFRSLDTASCAADKNGRVDERSHRLRLSSRSNAVVDLPLYRIGRTCTCPSAGAARSRGRSKTGSPAETPGGSRYGTRRATGSSRSVTTTSLPARTARM